MREVTAMEGGRATEMEVPAMVSVAEVILTIGDQIRTSDRCHLCLAEEEERERRLRRSR